MINSSDIICTVILKDNCIMRILSTEYHHWREARPEKPRDQYYDQADQPDGQEGLWRKLRVDTLSQTEAKTQGRSISKCRNMPNWGDCEQYFCIVLLGVVDNN